MIPELPQGFALEADGDQWLELARLARREISYGEIGGLELLEEVSRGGQGIVLKAYDNQSGEEVAVKRLLGGTLATPDARHRLDREIAAARSLDHPGVVKVHSHRSFGHEPVLVMEWVHGIPVTDWSKGQGETPPTIDQKLEMFWKICDAVRHAHQRGVIHHDLKPSNILVDEGGQPRVLDFGLARRFDPETGEPVSVTTRLDFAGTLAYASPEQLRGETRSLDVRTDVYSLGVLFYEMLTGRLPYTATGRLASWLDALRTQTPVRPSTLEGRVSRDQEAIILKAIELDRDRRYQTLDALADDAHRCLRGEPVTAVPPSAWSQLAKSVRRHPWPFASAAVLFLSMVIVTSSLAIMNQKTRRSQVRAEDEAQRANTILSFLLDDMFGVVDSRDGDQVTLTETLNRAGQGVFRRLQEHPRARADVHLTLAQICERLKVVEPTAEHAEAAMQIYRSLGSDDTLRLAESMGLLGATLMQQKKTDEGFELLDQARALQTEALGEISLPVARTLARLALGAKRVSDTVALLRECLQIHDALGDTDSYDALESRVRLAGNLTSLGQLAESEKILRQALDIRRQQFHEDHVEVAYIERLLALNLARSGRPQEAIPLYQHVLEIMRSRSSNSNYEIGNTCYRLGTAWRALGELQKAEECFEEALERTRNLGTSGVYGHVLLEFAKQRLEQQRPQEARQWCVKALDLYEDAVQFGEEHAFIHFYLGTAALRLNDLEGAEESFEAALGFSEEARGLTSSNTISILQALVLVDRGRGDLERSLDRYLEFQERMFELDDYDTPGTVLFLCGLAEIYEGLEELDAAEEAATEASEVSDRIVGDNTLSVARASRRLGQCLALQERWDESLPLLERSLTAYRQKLPDHTPEVGGALDACLRLLIRLDRVEDAQKLIEDNQLSAEFPPNHPEQQRRQTLASLLRGR